MTKKEWSELFQIATSLEVYFTNVLYKASNIRSFGIDQSNTQLAAAAKQVQLGTIGILEYFTNLRELIFYDSHAIKIPIENLDKPNLTLLQGGGD